MLSVAVYVTQPLSISLDGTRHLKNFPNDGVGGCAGGLMELQSFWRWASVHGEHGELPYARIIDKLEAMYAITSDEGKVWALEACKCTLSLPVHPCIHMILYLVMMDGECSYQVREFAGALLMSIIQQATNPLGRE
jgi:hypothetical protein